MSSAQDGTTPAAPAPVGPFETLSAMDPSRKYSLIFLMSVGTTLLLTGASGKRLLGRAQKATAPPSATPSPSSSPGPSTVPRPSASTSTPRPRPPPPSPLSQTPRESSSQLQKWRYTVPLANSLDPDPLPQALKKNYDYFLPNATILARSSAFAERLDVEDRLHKDGPEEFGNEGSQVDDGFNPALFAGKAFAIASAITFTTFAVGVASVMAYFGVTSLSNLSLALSHSVPPVLQSHRPEIPSWALPNDKIPAVPGEEEEGEEHKEGVAYWVEVKETLDREAEEMRVRRAREWENVKKK